MVDTRSKFYVPSHFGEDVMIESSITEFRRSSFDVHHRILKGDAVAVEGFETRVWVGRDPEDADKIKSRPIPQEVIRAFDG
jgi:4-hydroxybenzoyl-CoA thioesterase